MLTRCTRTPNAIGEHWLRRQHTSLNTSVNYVPLHHYRNLVLAGKPDASVYFDEGNEKTVFSF